MADTTRAQGRWPNAPLALVLAQVRFEPSPETGTDSVVHRLNEQIGNEFTRNNTLQQFSLVLGDGKPQQFVPSPETVGNDLLTEDGSRVLRVQSGALTYITSSYHNFPAFLAQWSGYIQALCGAESIRALRLGLRYVDFIIPSDGHIPENYLVEGFGRSPSVLGAQSPISWNLFDYEREAGGRLRIQYGRGFGPPSLPPDLMGTVPPPGSLTQQYAEGLSGVLDMDCWRPANEAMSADDIAGEFSALRDDIATAFRAIITPLATREWQTALPKG